MVFRNILLSGAIALTICIVCLSQCSKAISVEEELILSPAEKEALDKFKLLLEKSLPFDYMKTEIYLIKWLRRTDLDIPTAEKLLRAHLKWRKDLRLDGILDEDFSYYEDNLPVDIDGVDYTGRPVLAADAAEWDVRRAIITGRSENGIRHAYKEVEKVLKKIRDLQAQGKNVTQMIVIFDLNGYNLVQHGCLQCISIYLNFVIAFSNQYPGMADKIIFVNTPSLFQTVYELIRPAVHRELVTATKLFGTNKSEWRKYLLSIIPDNQLPPFLGGSRGENHT